MSNIRTQSSRLTRKRRVRAKILGKTERPRLSIFRSNKYIYAAIVDDSLGKTLVSASSREADMKKGEKNSPFPRVDLAYSVGKKLADKALEQKIKKIVFDRSGYQYMGQIEAIARGAREGGLEF